MTSATTPAAPATTPRVLLVGNPNVGKTTLFNTLTGARHHTANAPGTTTSPCSDTCAGTADERTVVDLPGTYSLIAQTATEHEVAAALRSVGRDDVAVVVLTATALERSLYLLAQVRREAYRVVGVLTKSDIGPCDLRDVDIAQLTALTGVEIVAIDPRERAVAAVVNDAVTRALEKPATPLVDADQRNRKPFTSTLTDDHGIEPNSATQQDVAADFSWVHEVLAVVRPSPPKERTITDRIDSVALRPLPGIPAFLALLWIVFELVTRVAAPVMAAAAWLVETGGGWLVDRILGFTGGQGTWIEGFLVDGVLVGVSTVASFVPLMAMTFAVLGALERSGYLARVAVMADRAMRRVGLDGRAVLPLVMGFGCNVPALAAAQGLPGIHQRIVASILIPYTACAARLTVFLFVATAFFPGQAGTAVFAMYLLSVLLVILGAIVTKSRGHTTARPFVVTMPPYQWPRWRDLVGEIGRKVRTFIVRSGRLVVAALAVMWLALAIPTTTGNSFGDVPAQDSAYGLAAEGVGSALAPLGAEDWRVGSALIAGLAAREATVGAFAQAFAAEDESTPSLTAIGADLRETLEMTSGGETAAAGFALMVLILVYLPCVTTLAELKRALGWRRASAAASVQIATAWILAVVAFQLGSLVT